MKKLLVVDDDPRIVDGIRQYFDRPEYEVYTMLEGSKVPDIVSKIKPDLILLDLKLPDIYGIDILKELRKRDFQGPIIIITGKVSAGVAMESMKEGAYEYLPKPFRLQELGELVDKLFAKKHESEVPLDNQGDYSQVQEAEELVGRTSEILKIGKIIGQAASSDAPVLITGESGTGKELIAKIIYRNSRRKDKPFIVVNCGYPTAEMLEEELFGRFMRPEDESSQKFQSKFELCKGGTIFLNDIERMNLSTQDKVLRALKKGEISTAGNKTTKVDVRIIAASSEDLSKGVSQGKFLQEFFYTLRVISISLPPLRERRVDIPLLIVYFLKKYSQQSEKMIVQVSADAMKFLMSYPWPGNVRELENNIHSAVVMCQGKQILPEHLPIFFEGRLQAQLGFQKAKDDYSYLFVQTLDPIKIRLFQDLKGKIHDKLISSLERALISLALKECRGNQVKAADLLGISRNTLRERMLKFGL